MGQTNCITARQQPAKESTYVLFPPRMDNRVVSCTLDGTRSRRLTTKQPSDTHTNLREAENLCQQYCTDGPLFASTTKDGICAAASTPCTSCSLKPFGVVYRQLTTTTSPWCFVGSAHENNVSGGRHGQLQDIDANQKCRGFFLLFWCVVVVVVLGYTNQRLFFHSPVPPQLDTGNRSPPPQPHPPGNRPICSST